MRLAAAFAFIMISVSALQAQVTTIEVETHLIDSTISVHDSQNRIVQDLSREDFEVIEDGVPQKIRFFAPATKLPISIGLVIDVSGSQAKFVKQHEKDIEAFLKQILQPQDQAFAVCFGNHLRLVSDFTNSASNLTSGIHDFDEGNRKFPELGLTTASSSDSEERVLGTALHDAIFFSITEKLATIRQRRKVIVVFSDGEENSSEHDLLDTIEAAQNANVLVYAVRYTDIEHGKMNPRNRYGMRTLDHISLQTGGKSYDARAKSLKQAFAEISDDLRSLYEVAYQSTNHVRDGSYRKVTIRTTQPTLNVRARTGYYAR